MWECVQKIIQSFVDKQNIESPVSNLNTPINKTLLTIDGEPVILDEANNILSFTAGLTIDADGCPRCYAPESSGLPTLDYISNAGNTNNWWGIVTKNGVPVIQGKNDPYPGYYISTTSYIHKEFATDDPRRYLDSEKVPFVVLPSPIFKMVKPIVLGSKVKVTNLKNGKIAEGLVGDVGPANHLGEASMAMASLLGIGSSPKTGGMDEKMLKFEVFLGVPFDGYSLQPS